MNEHLTPRQWEQISAALDGKLDPKKRDQFESALQSDPVFKQGMDEMAALRSILNSVAQRKAPRNFTLKPGQVKPFRGRNINLIFRIVSVSASVLMAALLAVEFLPGMFSPKLAAAPAAADMILMESAVINEPTTQPLIFWNGSIGGQQAFGMGGGVGGGAGGGDGNVESMAVYPPMTSTPYPIIFSEEPAAKEGSVPEPTPQESTPEVSISLEETQATAQEAVETTPEGDIPSEDVANPIIGIRPSEEWGKEVAGDVIETPLRETPITPPIRWLRFAEIGLGTMALAALLLAILYRRQR